MKKPGATNTGRGTSRTRQHNKPTGTNMQTPLTPLAPLTPSIPLADLLEKLATYGFRDEIGHPLENCIDFHQLIEMAQAFETLRDVAQRLNATGKYAGRHWIAESFIADAVKKVEEDEKYIAERRALDEKRAQEKQVIREAMQAFPPGTRITFNFHGGRASGLVIEHAEQDMTGPRLMVKRTDAVTMGGLFPVNPVKDEAQLLEVSA